METATKEKIRFPLRISAIDNEEIEKAILDANKGKMRNEKISKHKFIMEAIFEKIKREKGE